MKQLISFDLKADFGFLKKPDTNEPMYLTYNMIHKPCILGILGAILGERGFQKNEVLPDYYLKLKDTFIGIQPLRSEKGTFPKTVVKYNNGVGYASHETGGNLIVVEQTLIKPSYRIFLLTDHEELIRRIQNYEAEFLPYLGKNDFSLWWDNVQSYEYKPFQPNGSFKVSSIFIKQAVLKEGKEEDGNLDFFDFDYSGEEFMYFERLPIGYDEELFQYELAPFVFTNFSLKKDYPIENLITLDNHDIIQVF